MHMKYRIEVTYMSPHSPTRSLTIAFRSHQRGMERWVWVEVNINHSEKPRWTMMTTHLHVNKLVGLRQNLHRPWMLLLDTPDPAWLSLRLHHKGIIKTILFSFCILAWVSTRMMKLASILFTMNLLKHVGKTLLPVPLQFQQTIFIGKWLGCWELRP